MKKLSLIALSVVLALMSSANLWATDYLFGITVGDKKYFLGVPASPSSSGGTCVAVEITDDASLQRCIWHCVSSKGGTTPSDIKSSGGTGSYLYVQIGSTKYWLDEADGDNPITYSSSGYDFIFNSTGLAENSSSKYYVYRNSDNGNICTSSSSSKYSGKLLTKGAYWKFSASGSATSAGNGTVSVSLKESLVVATNSSTTGTTTAKFTATPSSGYAFVGWTDSVNGTTVTQGTDNPKTVTITNNTPGSTASVSLYAIFKPTYVVHFNPNTDADHTVTGTMSDKTFICGENGTLPALTFVNTISTTFDGDGGQLKNPSGVFVNSYTITHDATFKHWTDKGSPETTYSDQGTINRSGLTELNLYAAWNNPGVTYPEGKRGDRTLTKFDNGKITGQISWPNRTYTIKAEWSDPFYASMTATKSSGTTGTPTVDSSAPSSDYKGSNGGTATFTLTAPAASSGYYFSGWTGTGISFASAGSLSTTATVAVSNTAGSSNATGYTATANYEEYTRIIVITASGTPSASGDRVVFNVVGPQTYRVSVPVGGSVTLKDVASGTYTITPQGWSWSYTVSPTNATTSWNSENKSTHTFNFTPKSSTKKHSEVSATVKP